MIGRSLLRARQAIRKRRKKNLIRSVHVISRSFFLFNLLGSWSSGSTVYPFIWIPGTQPSRKQKATTPHTTNPNSYTQTHADTRRHTQTHTRTAHRAFTWGYRYSMEPGVWRKEAGGRREASGRQAVRVSGCLDACRDYDKQTSLDAMVGRRRMHLFLFIIHEAEEAPPPMSVEPMAVRARLNIIPPPSLNYPHQLKTMRCFF